MLSAKEAESRADLLRIVFVVAACAAWILLPAMDFDEALYVEMSRVMLTSKQFMQPIWDSQPLYDKPPTFMWSLLPFVSGHNLELFPGLSRLVPILSSVFVTVLSAIFVQQKLNLGLKSREFVLVGFSAFIPTIGSGLLLIDLLMSLALLPAFLFLYAYFHDVLRLSEREKHWRQFSWQENVVISASISAAAWLKGLIAWVIPGLSVVFFALLLLGVHLRHQKTLAREGVAQPSLFTAVRDLSALLMNRFWRIFCLSLLGTLVFYGALALDGHAEFVKEFFLQHHVGRGTAAMEGHSGPFFYHWLIVFFGGGWLTAGIARLLAVRGFAASQNLATDQADLAKMKSLSETPRNRGTADCRVREKSTQGRPADEELEGFRIGSNHWQGKALLFPLAWFATPIVFFSFIATKLPNYTWPSWMALPALFAAIYSLPPQTVASRRQRQLEFLSAAVSLVVGSAYFAVAVALIAVLFLVFDLPIKIDYRVQQIIDSAPRMSPVELTSCILIGLIVGAIGYQVFMTRHVNSSEGLLQKAKTVSLLHGLFIVTFVFGLASYPNLAYRAPVKEAANYLATHYPSLDVLTFGIKSPTFSSLYHGRGKIRQVGKDSNAYAEWATKKQQPANEASLTNDSSQFALVVPIWNKKNCDGMLAHEVARFRFLRVCIKARSFPVPPKTVEQ